MTAAVVLEKSECKKRLVGGGFFMEGSTPDSVFTLEDLSQEHLQIAEMTASFAEEQIRAKTDAIDDSTILSLQERIGERMHAGTQEGLAA